MPEKSVFITDGFKLAFNVRFVHQNGERLTRANVRVVLPDGSGLMPEDAPLVFVLSPQNARWLLQGGRPAFPDLAEIARIWLNQNWPEGLAMEKGGEARAS